VSFQKPSGGGNGVTGKVSSAGGSPRRLHHEKPARREMVWPPHIVAQDKKISTALRQDSEIILLTLQAKSK